MGSNSLGGGVVCVPGWWWCVYGRWLGSLSCGAGEVGLGGRILGPCPSVLSGTSSFSSAGQAFWWLTVDMPPLEHVCRKRLLKGMEREGWGVSSSVFVPRKKWDGLGWEFCAT